MKGIMVLNHEFPHWDVKSTLVGSTCFTALQISQFIDLVGIKGLHAELSKVG